MNQRPARFSPRKNIFFLLAAKKNIDHMLKEVGTQPRRFSCKGDYAAEGFPHFFSRDAIQINIFIRYLSRILFDARYLNISQVTEFLPYFTTLKFSVPCRGHF